MKKLLPLLYGYSINFIALFSQKKAANKAFNLFCTIRKGKVLPHQADYLNSAKHQCVDIEKHSVQTYQWHGNKETVLLVHGWESNTFRWRNLIEKLKEAEYNVIAFDAPAHGNSTGKFLYIPLYAKVIQGMIEKYKPTIIIGHSVGGMAIIYNEYIHANTQVSKIVTIASPSEFQEIIDHYQKTLNLNNQVMSSLDNYILNRFGFRIRDFSTSKYIRTNTAKGLLFHDRLDKITPHHASQKVHDNWKDSKFISTEGLGHSMHQDEVNQQIIDFLNS